MPQIRLKQNSPDFIDLSPQSLPPRPRMQRCDMPACPNAGDHRAPKDRSLAAHYHFCFDHVQEYNAAWNFFAGMADRDVERHIIESFYGDRPTWRADSYRGIEAELHRRIDAERFFTAEDPEPEKNAEPTGNPTLDALNILNLTTPTTFEVIKKRYRTLAKKYHPDHHEQDTANRGRNEELLKRINMAYTILKAAYAGSNNPTAS